MGETQALEAGERQQRRVDFSAFGLAQPRLDVAAQELDPEVRAQPARLRLAAQRGGAEARALGQGGNRVRHRRNQRVAHVLAFEEAGDRHALGHERRQILGRMHRGVDPPGEQGGVDLLGEEALAAGFRERPVLDDVAAGADDLERHRGLVPAVREREQPARLVRLSEGEGGAARAEGEEG